MSPPHGQEDKQGQNDAQEIPGQFHGRCACLATRWDGSAVDSGPRRPPGLLRSFRFRPERVREQIHAGPGHVLPIDGHLVHTIAPKQRLGEQFDVGGEALHPEIFDELPGHVARRSLNPHGVASTSPPIRKLTRGENIRPMTFR